MCAPVSRSRLVADSLRQRKESLGFWFLRWALLLFRDRRQQQTESLLGRWGFYLHKLFASSLPMHAERPTLKLFFVAWTLYTETSQKRILRNDQVCQDYCRKRFELRFFTLWSGFVQAEKLRLAAVQAEMDHIAAEERLRQEEKALIELEAQREAEREKQVKFVLQGMCIPVKMCGCTIMFVSVVWSSSSPLVSVSRGHSHSTYVAGLHSITTLRTPRPMN